MLERISEIDIKLLRYINGFSAESYDVFWLYVTNTFTWIPLFLFLLYFIYTRFEKNEVVAILVSAFIVLSMTVLFTEFIKELVMRVRPNNNFEVSRYLNVLKQPSDYSFPSGHAFNAMAVCTLLFFFLRDKTKWAFLLFLWPLLFSFSRIYMCVHYPSDVIAGLLMGFLFGYATYRFTHYNFIRDF